MNDTRVEPAITIHFQQHRLHYAPGDQVTADITVSNFGELDCRAAEASVVWHTVGQGDEDLHVHSFKRLPCQGAGAVDLSAPYQVNAQLPETPLSYDGVNIKVCWCVRLRLFMSGFRESSVEAPFRLGEAWTPDAPEVVSG